MKKIIVLVILLCSLTGCNGTHKGDVLVSGELTFKNVTDRDMYGYSIKEITYRGETHEYIIHSSGDSFGLAHWEGCKYCKNKENQ